MSLQANCTFELALARRVETALAQFLIRGARACARGGTHGFSAISIGGAQASFAGVASPYTVVIGLGLYEPPKLAHLEALEAFYEERHCPVRIALCMPAEPELTDLLLARNYRPAESEAVLTYSLKLHCAAPHDGSIHVCRASTDEIALFARTVAQGFLEAEAEDAGDQALTELGLEEAARIIEARLCGDDPPLPYLAFVEGQAAGGGSLGLMDALADLAGDSTLMRFRGRGVQTALIQARLAAAHRADCDLAACTVLPGSISSRNYERCGFHRAYMRTAFVREMNS